MTMPIPKLSHALLIAAALMSLPARADSTGEVIGRWRGSDGVSEIAITRCGPALCGKIVWLKQPHVDRFNPDPKLRERPLLGLQVLSDFKPDASGVLTGTGYNPEDGKSYRTTLSPKGPDTLEIRGCVLGGLVCDDDLWTRQR